MQKNPWNTGAVCRFANPARKGQGGFSVPGESGRPDVMDIISSVLLLSDGEEVEVTGGAGDCGKRCDFYPL